MFCGCVCQWFSRHTIWCSNTLEDWCLQETLNLTNQKLLTWVLPRKKTTAQGSLMAANVSAGFLSLYNSMHLQKKLTFIWVLPQTGNIIPYYFYIHSQGFRKSEHVRESKKPSKLAKLRVLKVHSMGLPFGKSSFTALFVSMCSSVRC